MNVLLQAHHKEEIQVLIQALVENQSGLHIKVLRTDRGGEYISKEFLRFCRENGIHKHFTTRYTPQQNGVDERNNRTIMDMTRSMLKAKHLPNDYWAEVVHCAVYILNRCPTKAVMNRVLEEAWSGRKQGVTHMRVFGCVAYAHIPDQLRRKLEAKGRNVFSLDTVKYPRPTGCISHLPRSSLLAEMFNSLKRKLGMEA